MADTAVTLSPARFTPLTNPERHNGFTHKWTIRAADIAFGAGSTDTVTVTLGTTPAKWICTRAMAVLRTVFGGTTGGLAVKIGATDDDFAIASVSVLSGSVLQPSTGANTVAAPSGAFGTSAQTLKAIFTNSTSGSPAGVTSGEMDIYLSLVDITEIG